MLQCDCGFEVRADNGRDLLAQIQRHAESAHGMSLSDDDALTLALRAHPDETSALTVPHQANEPKEEP